MDKKNSPEDKPAMELKLKADTEDKAKAPKSTKAQGASASAAKQKPAGNKSSGTGSKKTGFGSPAQWNRMHNSLLSGQRIEAYGAKILQADEDLPFHKHIQLLVIVGALLVFILWASFAELDQVTRGDGRVIPSSEVQIIQHQEGGIVDKFLAKEGDVVKLGQIIMTLRDVGAQADLGSSNAKYYGLKAKAERLQAEAEGKLSPEFSDEVMQNAPQRVQEELSAFRANRQQLDGQLSILQQQLNQRRQEVNEIQTRMSDAQRLLSLTNDELAMIRPLVDRGSAPKRDLLQLEQRLTEQQGQINGFKAALPRSYSAVNEIKARIDDIETTFQANAQNELSATSIEMRTIGETLSALEDREQRTDIRSPVDGIIKDFKINTVGGVIKPGDPVVEIVPSDDKLLVEGRIRPQDIAFIYPGQEAMVKITAYDFSIYGGLKGEVVDISADTITNEKDESFYRVKILTEQSELKRKGEILPIIPGMVASVDILTGDKTVMEYLLKPFIKTLDEAMNER